VLGHGATGHGNGPLTRAGQNVLIKDSVPAPIQGQEPCPFSVSRALTNAESVVKESERRRWRQTSNPPRPGKHQIPANKIRILRSLGLAGIELPQSPDVRQQRRAHRNPSWLQNVRKVVRMIVIINNEQARGNAVRHLHP